MSATRPLILCVDDEQQVLDGLALHLRRHFDVMTATSGIDGLVILEEHECCVVVSDMRMPCMDGAQFLGRARAVSPETTRVLLTGQADVRSAIAAVNSGQIFRLLTKPCSPEDLRAALGAAVEQWRLATAERVLLEQTVNGCVQALGDILSLVRPTSFGRVSRIKQLAVEIAELLQVKPIWPIEMAALFSQLGTIALPDELAEKAYFGHELSDEEQCLVDRVPAVASQLVHHIPRLELVYELLDTYRIDFRDRGPHPEEHACTMEARGPGILRAAIDYDHLQGTGEPHELVLGTLRSRSGTYDPEVLDAIAEVRGGEGANIQQLPIARLTPGMILTEDVLLASGGLFLPRGYQVTERFLERVRSGFAGALQKSCYRVMLTDTAAEA